jgi:hypothetical protein
MCYALSDERTGLWFIIATGLASAVILGFESLRFHIQCLLSQIRDFTNLEGLVPRNRVAQLYPHCWSWIWSYVMIEGQSASLSWHTSPEVEVYYVTDGQSASSSWCRASLWAPWPDFEFLVVWKLLASSYRVSLSSDERNGQLLAVQSLTGQSCAGCITI